MTEYKVEMDDGMLEKVTSGFPDLKFVKVEETVAGSDVAPDETPEKPGE